MACCESLELDPTKNYDKLTTYRVLVVSGSGGENTIAVYDTYAKAVTAVNKATKNGDTADISEVYEYVEV